MDPNYYAFIVPLLLGMTTVISLLVWSHDRRCSYLLWLAAAQCLLAAGVSWQMLMDTAQRLRYSPATTTIYLLGITSMAQAMASRFGLRLFWPLLLASNLLAMLGMAYASSLPASMAPRLMVMSLFVAAVHAQVLLQLRTTHRLYPLDRMAVRLYALFALGMLCRPLLVPLQSAAVADQWISQHIAWWFTTVILLVLCAGLTACLSASALLDTTRRLRHERNYDSLTGVLTRRAFEESVGQHPYAQGLRALIFADIDHFKRINDSHGHAVGDQVLRHIGQVLQQHLRAADTVGRIGGEEFALALRHVDMPQARKMIGRVSQHISTHVLPSNADDTDAPQQVTASFGLVLLQPQDTLSSAMHRADQLLYRAKAAGRNCVISENEVSS